MKQGSKEWLDFRKKGIGASDAPVIMGVSPYKTRYQLWLEKLGFYEQPITAAMQEGTKLEEEAREAYEGVTGNLMFPVVKMHPEHSWMFASLDGLSIDEGRAVEIKCGFKDYELAEESCGVLDKYYPQLQHQLAVLGHMTMHFFAYRPDKPPLLYQVKEDVEYINKMIEEEKKFWDMVQNLEPPELSEKDYALRSDTDWEKSVDNWNKIKAEKARIEKEEEECKAKLVEMAAGQNTKGLGVSVKKVIRKGNVDYKAIPEIKRINLEDYRKPCSTYWNISTYDTA